MVIMTTEIHHAVVHLVKNTPVGNSTGVNYYFITSLRPITYPTNLVRTIIKVILKPIKQWVLDEFNFKFFLQQVNLHRVYYRPPQSPSFNTT